jgi:hypothetical protein
MTQEEIIQGNKLIADFMGYPECGLKNKDPYYYEMKHAYENGNMRDHASWDWLMPVYKKCYDVWRENYKDDEVCASIFDSIWQYLWKYEFNEFYEEIIILIKYINTQTQQHGTSAVQ